MTLRPTRVQGQGVWHLSIQRLDLNPGCQLPGRRGAGLAWEGCIPSGPGTGLGVMGLFCHSGHRCLPSVRRASRVAVPGGGPAPTEAVSGTGNRSGDGRGVLGPLVLKGREVTTLIPRRFWCPGHSPCVASEGRAGHYCSSWREEHAGEAVSSQCGL